MNALSSPLQLGRVLRISTRVPVAAVFPTPGHVTWMMTAGIAQMSLRPAVNHVTLCWCQLIKIMNSAINMHVIVLEKLVQC